MVNIKGTISQGPRSVISVCTPDKEGHIGPIRLDGQTGLSSHGSIVPVDHVKYHVKLVLLKVRHLPPTLLTTINHLIRSESQALLRLGRFSRHKIGTLQFGVLQDT